MDFVKDNGSKLCKDRSTLILGVLSTVFIIIGIVLISANSKNVHSETVIDYTDCTDSNTDKNASTLYNHQEDIVCYISINITEPLEGQVTLYYELVSFDQSNSTYKQSRDDNQLRGNLSLKPSESCGKYSYDNGKPIAPCGAIADSMFNDTFRLMGLKDYVPVIYTGLDGIMEEDKTNYRNPPGDLQKAFEGFAKPINWKKNIWEENVWEKPNNLNNRGFENEAFIAWMKTDMKRKPAWRINHTGEYEHGLPMGTYTISVYYDYPLSMYNGKRLMILSASKTASNGAMLGFGIAFILLGILVIISKVAYNKKIYGNYVRPVDK